MTADGAGASILVVDDNPDNLRVLIRFLEEQGYTIRIAVNGEMALRSIETVSPDLILLDIHMPTLDGYEVCRRLKRNEQLSEIPIIFISALNEPFNKVRAFELGAADYIGKPFELAEVSARIGVQLRVRRAELALRQRAASSEEKYRRLVESLEQEYVFYSRAADGIFTYVSPSIVNVLGYTQAESLTHYSAYITNNPINTAAEAATQRILAGEQHPPFEIEVRHKNGTLRRLEIVENAVHDAQGTPVSVEGVAKDVTERARIEQQLRQSQKMEAIGTLAGGIAHDFNNILGGIIGFTELAYEDVAPDSPLKDRLKKVLIGTNRARDLVRQILTFSRQSEVEHQHIAPGRIVNEVLKFLRATIPRTIDIVQEIDPQVGSVMADPTEFHQIVMNLCTNAYQAMDTTGDALTVDLNSIIVDPEFAARQPNLHPGPYVKLTVSDTGCGMEQETLERIFEPFFTTKERDKGTGLGLSTVHGIVSSMGGVTTAESELGRGSTFTIYLPQVGDQVGDHTSLNAAPAYGQGERVLLVDDEAPIVQVCTEQLSRLGYEVSPFTSAVAALSSFRAEPHAYDLILSDYQMPEMSGLDLTSSVLRVRPEIPVFLVTGYGEGLTEESGRRLGARDVLFKPLSLKQLGDAIRNALDSSPLRNG